MARNFILSFAFKSHAYRCSDEYQPRDNNLGCRHVTRRNIAQVSAFHLDLSYLGYMVVFCLHTIFWNVGRGSWLNNHVEFNLYETHHKRSSSEDPIEQKKALIISDFPRPSLNHALLIICNSSGQSVIPLGIDVGCVSKKVSWVLTEWASPLKRVCSVKSMSTN